MAHPFAGQARSGSKAKFKALTGKSGRGQVHSDEAQDRKLFSQMMAERGDMKVSGNQSAPRADKYARGGRAKGNVNVNIILPERESAGASPPLLPPPLPPPGAMPPPGGPPPMMRKAGGRVNKARGGRFTGGADTGVGRKELTAVQRRRRG